MDCILWAGGASLSPEPPGIDIPLVTLGTHSPFRVRVIEEDLFASGRPREGELAFFRAPPPFPLSLSFIPGGTPWREGRLLSI
ncbi:hypothetical protein MASR2M17_04870 [Aminivibrio sp.]